MTLPPRPRPRIQCQPGWCAGHTPRPPMLSTMPTRNTSVGISREKPSDFPRATARTASRTPETTRTNHAMTDSSRPSCRVPGTVPRPGKPDGSVPSLRSAASSHESTKLAIGPHIGRTSAPLNGGLYLPVLNLVSFNFNLFTDGGPVGLSDRGTTLRREFDNRPSPVRAELERFIQDHVVGITPLASGATTQ
mgnify:CR=1 FL=1